MLTSFPPIAAPVAFTLGVNNGFPSMYQQFQILPPISNSNAIAGPGSQAAQNQEQRDHPRDEPSMPPFIYYTSQFSPQPAAGNTVPGPGLQPAQYQYQPLSDPSFMGNLYSFDTDEKHSEPPNEGGGDPRGPEN